VHRRRGTFHQKLRWSLHRGSSHACSEVCSESTHLTILTVLGRGSQRRQVASVAQGPEGWGAPSISALFCYTLLKPSSFTRVRGRWVLGTSRVRGSRKLADAETCTLRILSVPNVGRDTGLEGVVL
jgi:hypothetical protein